MSGDNSTVVRRPAWPKGNAAVTSSQVFISHLKKRDRSLPPRRFSNIDPILKAMLASNHGVSPASLLSPRPAPRWVSRDILR